jgi:hypothetical protein
MVVAGALLEVRMRRDSDQRQRDLLGAERIAERPELARNTGALVEVVYGVRADDGVVAHARSVTVDERR